MERIKSFCVDHRNLKKGIYLSLQNENIITYDIRMCAPYLDQPLDPKAAHTIEHLGASLLRNSKYKDQIIYFGPMGCLTGFYLIVKDLELETVKDLVKEVFTTISKWDKEILGAKKEECGNYTFMDLNKAKLAANSFISSSWQHQYQYLEK